MPLTTRAVSMMVMANSTRGGQMLHQRLSSQEANALSTSTIPSPFKGPTKRLTTSMERYVEMSAVVLVAQPNIAI